jgi:hypothetical protein
VPVSLVPPRRQRINLYRRRLHRVGLSLYVEHRHYGSVVVLPRYRIWELKYYPGVLSRVNSRHEVRLLPAVVVPEVVPGHVVVQGGHLLCIYVLNHLSFLKRVIWKYPTQSSER